jgi:hypothetical protein
MAAAVASRTCWDHPLLAIAALPRVLSSSLIVGALCFGFGFGCGFSFRMKFTFQDVNRPLSTIQPFLATGLIS